MRGGHGKQFDPMLGPGDKRLNMEKGKKKEGSDICLHDTQPSCV